MIELRDCGPGLEESDFSIGNKGQETWLKLIQPNIRTFGGDILDEDVLLCPGWTETAESLRLLAEYFARTGRRVVILQHTGGRADINKSLRAPGRRVEATITASNHLANENESQLILGHSLGGIDAARAIDEGELNPKSLILAASAGLITLDNFLKVARRVGRELVSQESRHLVRNPIKVSKFAKESIWSVINDPLKIGIEGYYASKYTIGDKINQIADNGTVVINIVGDKDEIYPYLSVLADTEDLRIDRNIIIKNGTHNFTTHMPQRIVEIVVRVSENTPKIVAQRLGNSAFTLITNSDELAVADQLQMRNDSFL